MWFEWIHDLRQKRSTWVRDIQPQLVAADQSVALGRIGLCLAAILFLEWSSRHAASALTLSAVLMVSVIRYYAARHQPVVYAHWRWLLFLVQSALKALAVGNVMYFLATPSKDVFGYCKNVLLASGMVVSIHSGLVDKEMFLLSCPCDLLLLAALYHHSDKVCEKGLVANEYGLAMTQRLFDTVGYMAQLVANVARPFESDPALSGPWPNDPGKHGPACTCVLRTLLVALGFILPNSLLYLYEEYALELRRRQRRQVAAVHPQPGGAGPVALPLRGLLAVLSWVHLRLCFGAMVVTVVGGSWVWLVLRLIHNV